MIDLYAAELIKQGGRPLHRRFLFIVPALLLLGAILVALIRLFGVQAELPPLTGVGVQFAASLFGFLGVILGVLVAASIGSCDTDFGTARLMYTQDPRRWRHALVRVAVVFTWFLVVLILTAVAAVILDLAVGLHSALGYDITGAFRALSDLGRVAATALPVLLIALLGATVARALLGGIFAWLVYSILEAFTNNLAGADLGQLAPALGAVSGAARAVAPWLLNGLGAALEGQGRFPAGVAALALVVWIAVLTGLLVLVLERRDVA